MLINNIPVIVLAILASVHIGSSGLQELKDLQAANQDLQDYIQINNVKGDEGEFNENDVLLSKNVSNELSNEDKVSPLSALKDVILECLPRLSYACARNKFSQFISVIERVNTINVVGDSVTIVHVNETESEYQERLVSSPDSVFEITTFDRVGNFIDNHVIRVSLPTWTRVEIEGSDEEPKIGGILDFRLGNSLLDEGKDKYFL